MTYSNDLKNAMPVAPLKLLVLNSAAELGSKVNNYLVGFRNNVTMYITTILLFRDM